MASRRQSSNSILHFKDQNILENVLSSYRELKQNKTRKNSLAHQSQCEAKYRNVLGSLQIFSNTKSSILQKNQNISSEKNEWATKTNNLFGKKKQQTSKELLCSKIMMNKKLQKIQKQAISQFSAGNFEEAFKLLQKGHSLLKRQKIQSKQHQIYLCYLKIHFSFKSSLKLISCQQQFQRANALIGHCSKSQRSKLNEYILTIKCYQIQHLCSHIQYSKSLLLIKQLEQIEWGNATQRKEKMFRKINKFKIICLKNLRRFGEAIQVVNRTLQTSQKSVKNLQEDVQFLILTKYSCLIQVQEEQSARNFLLNFIMFSDQQYESQSQKAIYTFKIWETYYNSIKKIDDKLYLIYYLTQWRRKQKKNQLKICQQLFNLYFQIGDFEQANTQFQRYTLCNPNNPDFTIYQHIVQVKLFYDQKQQALQILSLMLQIFPKQINRLQTYLKIIEISPEMTQQQQALEKEIQKIFKKLKPKTQEQKFKQLFERYVQNLVSKGKKQRCKKLKQKLLQLPK